MTGAIATLETEHGAVRMQAVTEGSFSLYVAQYEGASPTETTVLLNRDQALEILEAMKELVTGPMPADGQ
ncbi:MAG: hypothetical protein H7338_24200 [Candidatus Sericytochromatia bacterium]|nr:hypothetical protein [Candidatus Sericytochromatia bacterium]